MCGFEYKEKGEDGMRDVKSMLLKKAAKAVKSVADKTDKEVSFTSKGYYRPEAPKRK